MRRFAPTLSRFLLTAAALITVGGVFATEKIPENRRIEVNYHSAQIYEPAPAFYIGVALLISGSWLRRRMKRRSKIGTMSTVEHD